MMAISNEELIAKAREAKSAEELLALAKENDVELTEEGAEAYFEQMNKTGELEDDELDSVAGGGCHKKDGRLVVTVEHFCGFWKCKDCGGRELYAGNLFHSRGFHTTCWGGRSVDITPACKNCKDMSYEKGMWLCNEPRNRK
ncbi:MAG: hypothetical protein K2K87_07425 [Lachnospiraceae bacterium]|nr:hypothetical protein [Lachnospiraceae bacterium]